MKNSFPFRLFLTALLAVGVVSPALAKKKEKKAEVAPSAVGERMRHLSDEDRRLLDSLSKHQKELILKGKIEEGFNSWMVKMALGEPYYATEHHPVYTDYEEVWLYTKPDITNDVKEEQIIDRSTQWPTIHRTTRKKSCMVGDFFVLWDRGVVQEIHHSKDKRVFGSCTLETSEAYLPIVDGKPVEPKK